jgi:uncharacterized protein YndB with AHSA1/START domain
MALTRRIVLEATAAEVWDKVATGPGLSSWYVPHELEPRKGGVARADFGGGTIAEGRIRTYEPGRRIVYAGEAAAQDLGGEPKALAESPTLEFAISQNGGDPEGFADVPFRGIGDVRGFGRRPGSARTVLNFRQDGFPEEGQEVFEEGWDFYFYNLTQYFTHFRGKTPQTATALVLHQRSPREGFDVLSKALGIDDPDAVEEGKELRLAPRGRDAIEGVVDLRFSGAHIEAVGIRDEAGLLRAMSDETCGGAIFRYEYVVDPPPDFGARARDVGQEWQGWLEQQFA